MVTLSRDKNMVEQLKNSGGDFQAFLTKDRGKRNFLKFRVKFINKNAMK